MAVAADLTTKEGADRAVAETVDHFGHVDVVINAIGGGAGKVLFDAQDYPDDAWEWIIDLNVTSTLLPTQYAVKAMIEGGRGGKVLNPVPRKHKRFQDDTVGGLKQLIEGDPEKIAALHVEDAGVAGVPWPGADQDVIGLKAFDLVQGYFVAPVHMDAEAVLHEHLHQIVGE